MNNEQKRAFNLACAEYEFPNAKVYVRHDGMTIINDPSERNIIRYRYYGNEIDLNRLIENAEIDELIANYEYEGLGRITALHKCVCSLVGCEYE